MVEARYEDNCVRGYSSKNLQTFLNIKRNFDVIVIESFNSDCFLGLVHKFPAPVVGISSCTIMNWYNKRFGNPAHPAYIPNNLMWYSDQLTFFERVGNTLISIAHQFAYDYVIVKNDEHVVREYLGRKTPPLSTIGWNMSLLLVNTHFTYNLPRPLVPNVIEIGGIHIDNRKQLPKVSFFNLIIKIKLNFYRRKHVLALGIVFHAELSVVIVYWSACAVLCYRL